MRRRSIVLAILPCAAVALAWSAIVAIPSTSRAADLDRRLESTDTEVRELSAQMVASRELEVQIVGLRAELAVLEQAVPETADLAGLVRLIDRVAGETGLRVAVVSPEPLDSSGSVTVAVTGTATYSELIAFVNGLMQSERFVLITSLDLEGGQSSDRLEIGLTLEVFTTASLGSAAADPSAALAFDDAAFVDEIAPDSIATLEEVSE